MRYRWKLPAELRASVHRAEIERLVSEVHVPLSIATVLASRGITTFEDAREFFRPSIDKLFDPFLLKDMDLAVARVRQAFEQNERVVIYGDYDVDGTTSTAMLVLYLRSLARALDSHADITFHIPDRFTEGYGLSTAGIDRCLRSERGAPHLIISIDCGITAVDAVQYARSNGIDILICDHHEPGEVIPNANAILNPLRPGCSYPNRSLCGCGVGFKLVQALCQTFGLGDDCNDYLDFVALASSADIVSLKGENRILTSFGLKYLNESPRPGLNALINAAHLKLGRISTSQVVFGIAPRINAAGRLGDGGRSVQLMMAETDLEATTMASELELENLTRRRIDEEAFFEACFMVDGSLNRVEDKIIVLHNPDWHAGVIGIVASRLVERYHLPVVLLTTIDGVAKGSARSIHGFDIHSAIKRCEDKVITFGGHKYAAGVAIETHKVHEFKHALNSVAHEMISEDMLQAEIDVHAELDLNELTPRFFAIIRQFAPFGPDNPRPTFYAKNVEVVGVPRTVGKATPHLKFQARSSNILTSDKIDISRLTPNLTPFTLGGATIEAIGFSMGERLPELMTGGRPRTNVELVFSLEENEYNGKVSPQLVLRDFR